MGNAAQLRKSQALTSVWIWSIVGAEVNARADHSKILTAS